MLLEEPDPVESGALTGVQQTKNFTIVGIGASAGGMDALIDGVHLALQVTGQRQAQAGKTTDQVDHYQR